MDTNKYSIAIKKAVEEHKEEYIALLQKMISFDSKIIDAGKLGEESGIQGFLFQMFEEMGARVDAFEPDNS